MASTLLNSADIAGTLGTDSVTFGTNQVSTTIITGLTAVKSADQNAWVNGPLTYTAVITNNSGEDLSGATLTDILDTTQILFNDTYGVLEDDQAVDYTYNAGVLTITLNTIPDGSSSTITFQVLQNS